MSWESSNARESVPPSVWRRREARQPGRRGVRAMAAARERERWAHWQRRRRACSCAAGSSASDSTRYRNRPGTPIRTQPMNRSARQASASVSSPGASPSPPAGTAARAPPRPAPGAPGAGPSHPRQQVWAGRAAASRAGAGGAPWRREREAAASRAAWAAEAWASSRETLISTATSASRVHRRRRGASLESRCISQHRARQRSAEARWAGTVERDRCTSSAIVYPASSGRSP
mmetsp:Transcript_26285/g.83274  ORF Transcript_26285/g.83274 Transcript_26285/m.83274 type:complete len:232 (-) Transcript_26285:414-1109(-)